ncbi:MAG: SDR family NAD(P)-dependent oxidoreductase, partial [Mycobacterium sp.]|nr:SDR family NAD(P)-dependent oxidoreductase [Mycobacterium sp.]
DAVITPLMRRGRPESHTALRAAAELEVTGTPIDWAATVPEMRTTPVTRVGVPTYAFDRARYWLPTSRAGTNIAAIGQTATEHPLLAAVIPIPDGGVVLTGRWSSYSHQWLSEQLADAAGVLPSSILVELVIRAGEETGTPHIRHLTPLTPLVLNRDAEQQVQVTVGAADEVGDRPVTLYSRTVGRDLGEWLEHARGLLTADDITGDIRAGTHRSPVGAAAIDMETVHARLTDLGYGSAFGSLRNMRRHGGVLFVEVGLPAAEAVSSGYRLHPALLESLLQSVVEEMTDGTDRWWPQEWEHVRLHVGGADSLRARITLEGTSAAIEAFDEAGDPVLSVGRLTLRKRTTAELGVAGERLLRVEWQPVTLGAVAPVPYRPWGEEPAEVLVLDLRGSRSADMVRHTTELVVSVLSVLQRFGAGEYEGSRLLVVTSGAVAANPGEAPVPASAAVWGLVRSAQSEDPGRVILVDDCAETELSTLVDQIVSIGEPQVAVRDSRFMVPRLRRERGTARAVVELSDGPVLITGGTGGLGALLARHLVSEYGVRSLVLASRRGPEAPGADALVAELEERGAQVRVVACDVSVREQVAHLLDGVPVTGVVHAAGVLDDGVMSGLTPARVESVLGVKASGAWWLHEELRLQGIDVGMFVLFSSLAGVIGNVGQGSYSAANCFLDALAEYRSAQGLAGTSIAWGLWAESTGMTAHLGDTDTGRLHRGGFREMSSAEGLAMFDRAVESGLSTVGAATLDSAALLSSARRGSLPAVLAELIPPQGRTPVGVGVRTDLASRVVGLPEQEQTRMVSDVIRREVAAILGHTGAASIDMSHNFKELGFDSVAAVELRNLLTRVVGLPMPTTLVFDYPTPRAVSEFVLAEIRGGSEKSDVDTPTFRRRLAEIPLEAFERAGVLDALLALASETSVREAFDVSELDTEVPDEDLLIDEMDSESLIKHIIENSAED